MTIALGLIADSGIVIAADRQETEGDHKKAQRKIDSLWAIPVGGLLVSGAGNSSYIDTMTEHLQFCFGRDLLNDADSSDGMTEKFRSVHSTFYSEAVLPFAQYQAYERPDYELLFGCSTQTQHLLWYSYKLTLNRAYGYRAVGIGASAAESLLKKFYVTNLPLKVAVSLAAFVVYQVKNSVEGCGLETDVLFTRDLIPCRVSAPQIEKMEDAFAKFGLLERDDLYKCIGGGVVPRNRNARDWNKFRRELSKTFDSFYEGFDAQVSRNPPSPPVGT